MMFDTCRAHSSHLVSSDTPNKSSSRLKLPKRALILEFQIFSPTSSKPKKLILTSQSSRQLFYLSSEIIDGMRYLRSTVVTDVLAVAAHHIITKFHGAKTACGVSEEEEFVQLFLDLPVGLLVACGRRCVVGVVIEVAEGGKEGTLLDLGLLEVLLLERLLVESSLGLVLARGVLSLAHASTKVVVRASIRLALLGVTGDKVVGVAAVEASILRSPHRQFWRLLWNRVNGLATSANSSSPRLSICSSVINNKENIAAGELEKEPPPETRAIVGALGFSILARVWWSIFEDLSSLNSSSTVRVS
jgi:hypothetical protein